MSAVTTHVLDAAQGAAAAGVSIRLEAAKSTEDPLAGPGSQVWTLLAAGLTDDDGRIGDLGPDRLDAGDYRLTFETGEYFDRHGVATFYPRVQITFRIADPEEHYHVPLLLSPFAYSTYRGS
ncbi:hydroxyisourate hydrolase [Saccharopolyspora phatthalungensis]|uniref:5-hydroxyisourate hydrolase n=1 Tax=Saccharopolyspora phatthalungensis TaxID=664693 RepID=A0A840QD17_9PSEU|nr:hydroxyisourate hydrolase [Saccharopolyspora phatthalungensis]MBB5154823.1 5-hydroxyisourate hydrolase [Saccharopolyspora phatthalungensis]